MLTSGLPKDASTLSPQGTHRNLLQSHRLFESTNIYDSESSTNIRKSFLSFFRLRDHRRVHAQGWGPSCSASFATEGTSG